MSRRHYRVGSLGIGFAAAGLLFLGQAGAAHAPIAAVAIHVPVTTAALPAYANTSSARFSAQPFKRMRISVPAAALRLAPALRDVSCAKLAMGPLRFPDGALKLPGRLEPAAPAPEKPGVQEVGHSVSVPSAILMAEPFNVYPSAAAGARHDRTASGFADLPLVSAAHAAQTEGLGGPLSRMPIEGHILFEDGGDSLSAAAQAQLDRMVETLRTSHATLDVVAYGGERRSRASEARRLSLRRGLAVRSYLIARGIEHKRISVRPIGGARDGGPEARVDVFYASY